MKLSFLLFAITGIVLNTGGACIIGFSDNLSDDRIAELANPTILTVAADKKERLGYPLAKEFLKRRQKSRLGIFLIIIGSIFLTISNFGF
jgi:hypothetical protein